MILLDAAHVSGDTTLKAGERSTFRLSLIKHGKRTDISATLSSKDATMDAIVYNRPDFPSRHHHLTSSHHHHHALLHTIVSCSALTSQHRIGSKLYYNQQDIMSYEPNCRPGLARASEIADQQPLIRHQWNRHVRLHLQHKSRST